MVNIGSCNCQALGRMQMVYIRLNAIGISTPLKIQIMGYKLVFSSIFIYNISLPAEEFVHQSSLEFLKFCAKASIDRTTYIWKILPCIDSIAPIIQAKFIIHGIQIIMEFFTNIFHKLLLHIFASSSVIFRLIIQLETNDALSMCCTLHQFSDYTFRIEKVHRMGNIHDLTGAINTSSLYCLSQNIRMCLHHPGRHSIGRRTDDHIDSCLFHGIHYSFHMGKIKFSWLWLAGAPGRLRNSNGIDSCFFHHFHIFIQAVIRHILIIICCSVKKFFHIHPPLFFYDIIS